ncbi:ABC transporter substrate-binding protein [Streptomyces sp. NPDC058953]|uniref:ABC transporter substrate-binding protein n=1 Tax=unclassified Streptomyces TaxID=2593676 RepID=UPI00369CBE2F
MTDSRSHPQPPPPGSRRARRPAAASRAGSPTTGARTRPTAVTAVAVAGALLATGCGRLPGIGDGSPEPVTVMTFAPEGTSSTNMPGMPAIAKAYARWANATGGIDGHELRVITCNEKNTPAGASECARQAVDEGVDAVVGSYSQHGGAFMAPLEAASIPYIGGYGLAAEEFTSYVSYPVNGGQAALLAGQGLQLAQECREVSIVRPDSAAGDRLPRLLGSGLAAGDHDAPADVLAPDNASDYTREARKARQAAGDGATGSPGERPGCVTAALGERTETFVDSYRRLPDDGREIRFSSVTGSVGQSLINRTGGRNGPYEGAFVTGWYPGADDSRWNPMKEVVGEHAFGDNRIDPADSGVQTTWIAFSVLTSAIRAVDADEITSRKIIRTLDSGLAVSTGGLTPTLRWKYGDLEGIAGYPRAVNSTVTFHVVRDGKLTSQQRASANVSEVLTFAPR